MAQGLNYSGNLSGAEEVPGPDDPHGTGTATATMDMATGQSCVTLQVSNITLPAAAAHIHEGARGVAGPVVVPLTAPDANGMSEGCVAVAADRMSRITANPSNFYFNRPHLRLPGRCRSRPGHGDRHGTGCATDHWRKQ
jgi:hypothetical protein